MGRGVFGLFLTGGLLGLLGALLLLTSPAAAGEPGKPKVLGWEPGRITGTVSLGQTISRTVSLTVSQAITNPQIVVRPKKFAGNVSVSGLPSDNLQPGQTYQLTVTATVSGNLRGRAFNFNVFVRSDIERPVIGPPLKVRLKLEHGAKPARTGRPGK
jgi:hypothetical protein